MLKQIELHGRRFEFCSTDGGRTWSSDPRSLIAFRKRQERARAELRKRFEEVDEDMFNPDPREVCELLLPKESGDHH